MSSSREARFMKTQLFGGREQFLDSLDVEPPIGLILGPDKSEEHVELRRPNASVIHIAKDPTGVRMEALEKKLHDSILLAGEGLAQDENRRPITDYPEKLDK